MDMQEIAAKATAGELTYGDIKEMLTSVMDQFEDYDEDDFIPLQALDVTSMSGEEIQRLVDESGQIGLLIPMEVDEDE
jgi:hypothetical protein